MARTILAVANQTIGGQALIDAILEKAGGSDDEHKAKVVICVPRSTPTHGNIIYDDAVYDAAQVRIDLARGFLRQRGIEAIGDVGDPDPYTATMDAVAEGRAGENVFSPPPPPGRGALRPDPIERTPQGRR